MMQSNMKYNWRLDILRNHTKIGEAKIKAMQINFVEDANITRSLKATIPKTGFNTNQIKILKEGAIYFNSSLFFDGTWCFDIGTHWESQSVDFDMFSDRLRPILINNGEEYNFGDFIVIAAPSNDDGCEQVYNIEAYDETMKLSQSTLRSRKYYSAGTSYMNIIMDLLTECKIDKIVKEDTNSVITVDHEYSYGTEYLTIINNLLDEIAYSHIYMGADGYCFIRKKTTKNMADYYYNDSNSTLISEIKNKTDIYSLPNVIVGYVSSPDLPNVLRVEKINDNPKSIISTVRRGYDVVVAYQFDDCPDLDTLSKAVEQKYLEVSQATESMEIETMPDDNHDYGSYIALEHLGESGLYREVEWSITAYGSMSHKLERKVLV